MIDTAQEEEKSRAEIAKQVGRDVTPPQDKPLESELLDALGSYGEQLKGGGTTEATGSRSWLSVIKGKLNKKAAPHQEVVEKAA